MGFDRARVVEVYSRDAAGRQRVGSGYLVSDQVVLTADHVVAGLPVQPTELSGSEQCEVRPLGLGDWLPAQVVRHDPERDVALLRLVGDWRPPAGSPAPGWGRLDGVEPVGCMAVGFPWAQARPDQVCDTEQLFGQIAPLTTAKAGRLAVNVVTAPPTAAPDGGSPWAGMSGAALFAGPYLVGVVVVDPDRYGTDRLQATPISALVEDSGWWQSVGGAGELVGVGPRFRLAVTTDLSLVLTPPYRPLPAGLEFGSAPVRLLLAEHGIVPFLGRRRLLDDLQAWCAPVPSMGVQVLTGSGGAGKTRLAAELCVTMQALGWDAGFADRSSPDGQTQLSFERPTLLVIDDADLQVQLIADILNQLASRPSTQPPRLLLLARYQGAWWEQLNIQTDGLADDYAAPQLSLETGALSLDDRRQHRDSAAAVFAAQLTSERGTVELPDLADPVFANPLLIHMSVLLALLGEPVANTRGGAASRSRVLQRLLGRERKRWTPSLRGMGLADLSDRLATQAVTMATLTSPQTRADAVGLLQAVPDLADADLERRGRIADWLHQLYPGEPGYVAPLRPDLMAEQQLADTPDLAQLTVNIQQHATSAAQVAQLLTELTRTARAYPSVQTALGQLLDAHVSELLDHALTAPTSPIPGLLSQALQIAPHPEATAQLVNRLPQRSTALAVLAATIGEQAVQHYRALAEADPDAYLPDLAGALGNLGVFLFQVGRREQALAPAQEAVAAYRRLAEVNPDAHLSDLAMALNNLGVLLLEVGWLEQALAPAQEAVAAYRRLAEVNPDAHLSDLAGALTNLGVLQSRVGRRKQALAPAQEAVAAYRRLAEVNPDAYLSDLAMALNNLGNRLSEVGRPEQGLVPAQEAVAIRRRLAEVNPDAYLPALATALNNLGNPLSKAGRWEQALASTQEAVAIRRRLAEVNPDAHLPDLAGGLHNLGMFLSRVGRREQALAPAQEAVAIRRRLAEVNPDAHLPHLAGGLSDLGILLFEVGRPEQALAPAQEAVAAYRRLAEVNPDAYLADLTGALNNLGVLLLNVGRPEQALAPTQEAVAAYRRLAEVNPDAYLPLLANALNNVGRQLSKAGRHEDMTEVEEELASVRARMGDSEDDGPS